MRIRCARAEDIAPLLELWRRAGATPTAGENVPALERLLAHDPQALLVAEADGRAVGSLIAAWNGWRASLYRLVVEPDWRRRGVATALVRDAERRLCERGALRVDAIVTAHEPVALSVWSALGYQRQLDRTRFVRDFV